MIAIVASSTNGVAGAQAHGAPAISGPVTARELVEAGGLSGLAVSPDGAYVIVRVDWQSVVANQTQLHWQVLRARDGHAAPPIDAGAPRWNVNGYIAVETPQWSPDSTSIYFRKLQGEEVQVWRAGRDGAYAEQLTNDAADVRAFLVTTDGHLRYAVGPATRDEIKAAESVEYDNGVLLDATIIKGLPVVRGFPANGRMATWRRLPGALNLGRTTLLGDSPLRVFSVDPDNGSVTPAGGATANRVTDLWRESGGGVRAPDPGKNARAVSRRGERAAAIEASTTSSGFSAQKSRSGQTLAWRDGRGASAICADRLCIDADRIAIVGWAPNGHDLVFQTRTFGNVHLNIWNVVTNVVRTVLTADGVLGSDESGAAGECQLADDEAICIAAAASEPPRVVAINLYTGEMRILLDPNPRLSPDRLGASQTVVVRDRFGSSTIGRLITPRSTAPRRRLPLVITSYSCDGFLLGGSGRDVPEHVLAGLGIAAICIDLSGEVVQRARDFVWTQSNAELSSLDFFEDAVRALDQGSIIDPGQVVLTGFSGSATATAFAITQSTLFTAAIVTTEGSIDPISCYLTAHFRSCEDWARREGYSRPYDSHDGILRNSPAWNVEKITTPLLMQLAEVEYESMMQLYGAMLDYGRSVEMYVFADAYHYKNQARQRLAVYDRNVDWINFWLRGEESGRPDRALQNIRWRAMRVSQCALFDGGDALPDPPWYCLRGREGGRPD